MKCIICNSNTRYYFTTDFNVHFGGKFKEQLDISQYYRCTNCGFTFSKTVYDMSQQEWEDLNVRAHTEAESEALNDRVTNQPPYFAQASMINLLIKDGIIGGGQ